MAAAPGVAQQSEDSMPVSYGFVIDNSGSMRLRLERIIRLVSQVAVLNGPEDETFLVSFIDSEKISVKQEMTSNVDAVIDEAENMFIQGGRTAIIDAVRLSATYLSENGRTDEGRLRRLIVITDGDERESRSKLADLIDILQKEKIAVFVVGIGEQKVETKLIDRIVKDSGGKRYLPISAADIDVLIPQLAGDIRK
jgi:Mg-chelatase subunit ChlD